MARGCRAGHHGDRGVDRKRTRYSRLSLAEVEERMSIEKRSGGERTRHAARPGLALTTALGLGLIAACGTGSAPPAHTLPAPTPSRTTSGRVFDVTQYGAKGDNLSDNTHAFATAIAAAEGAGGGVVHVPPGTDG